MRGLLDQSVRDCPVGLLTGARNGDVGVYLDNFTFPLTVFRGGRCTKFEVNQTNLKRVILPTVSSVSSGDLSPDISLTSGLT